MKWFVQPSFDGALWLVQQNTYHPINHYYESDKNEINQSHLCNSRSLLLASSFYGFINCLNLKMLLCSFRFSFIFIHSLRYYFTDPKFIALPITDFYRQTWLKTFKILSSFIGNWWRDQYFSLEIKRQTFSRLIPQVYKLWQPVLHWTSINTLCQISSVLNRSLLVAVPSPAGGNLPFLLRGRVRLQVGF